MLLLLELNEVNFEFVEHYTRRGHLPNFKRLLERHGYVETVSEKRYDELEPWIQWVTAHTGLTLAEHGVHHLGDIADQDIEQIWEVLAGRGLKVGAISPMNAKCRSDGLAFFIPDPWTKTGIVAKPIVRRLYSAISQAVNDNASSRITASSLGTLVVGMATIIRPGKYGRYFKLVTRSLRRPWLRPIVLDQLLADLFIKSVRDNNADFATLFLNAAAHIQHHYMFSSDAYDGDMQNPAGYVAPGMDPLLDMYSAYDTILGDVLEKFPQSRIMLATGLHQDPHPTVTYYWRLRDHAAFLRKLGVAFETVSPRMSRDFVITFADPELAGRAKDILKAATAEDGKAIFEIEEQDQKLFVMLSYPCNIDRTFRFAVGQRSFDDLHNDVVFVALKNGQHNGIGYYLDTAISSSQAIAQFELKELPSKILAACS